MMKVSDIRQQFVQLYDTQDLDGATSLELLGSSFEADAPSIFGAVNHDYINRELDWYLSQSLNVNRIPGGPPKIWQQVSDTHGYINSNYGYLVFAMKNGNQYNNVLAKLKKDPDSRQGTMVYTRPTVHRDAVKNGRSDFICTNAVNYFITNGKLCAVVQMRSNDAVFGYRNDFAWQEYIQLKLANDLDVTPGKIVWQVANLHVYARHFHLIETFRDTGQWDVPVTKKD